MNPPARARPAGRRGDPEPGPGEVFLEQFADAVVVVDDQQMARSGGGVQRLALQRSGPVCLTRRRSEGSRGNF